MRYQGNQLQQLRGFCYAAKAGSISKAAAQLGLSQPSVSLQIQALETELGAQLFERRGPKIRLTHDGELLLDLARSVIEDFERLPDDFASLRDSLARGSVNIAAGGSTLQYILPPYVEAFVHEFPQVDLRLHNVTGKTGLSLLRTGEMDIAIGPMLETPPDIIFDPLETYEPMLITSVDHPLAKRKRVTLRDISRHPLILPPRDQSTFRLVEAVFAERSLSYEVRLEVGGYEIIKTYVRLGLGVAIVMSHCLTGQEHLHALPLKNYFPRRRYGLVMRKNRPLTLAAQSFVDMLHKMKS